MIKIKKSTTVKVTTSDGLVQETKVERLGFRKWRGTKSETRPDGRSNGAIVHGSSQEQVRRLLGMDPVFGRQVQKGGDGSVQVQSGGDIHWNLG